MVAGSTSGTSPKLSSQFPESGHLFSQPQLLERVRGWGSVYFLSMGGRAPLWWMRLRAGVASTKQKERPYFRNPQNLVTKVILPVISGSLGWSSRVYRGGAYRHIQCLSLLESTRIPPNVNEFVGKLGWMVGLRHT